jgi:hypothetical protein
MIQIEGAIVRFDEHFAVSFQRTLRVPDDGRVYPLPPGLGTLPVFPIASFAERLPAEWRDRGGVLLPMYQREALWLGFHVRPEQPRALKVAVGGFNALSGAEETGELHASPQDYLVCPPQNWLDGVRTERGNVRQFVAVALGQGKSLEASLRGGVELRGGLQLTVFRPHPGAIVAEASGSGPARARSPALGFGLGGAIEQKVYPDPHGIAVWDASSAVELDIHVLGAHDFRLATGLEPPPSPIDAHTYAERGLPWFELYDEDLGDLGASELLEQAATLAEQDALHPDTRQLGSAPPRESIGERALVIRRIRLKGPSET